MRQDEGPLLRRITRRLWPDHPTTWSGLRERALPAAENLVRMTVGGVVAYLLTLVVTDGPVDLTGALTALLVMQASASGSMKMGLVRVGAVVTGVAIALLVSIAAGLSWWTLALVIFASLLLAKVFRLGDQALETPISGMLILAASGQEIAAEVRVVTTLIGTVVGIALPILWPSAVPVGSAAASVRRVASGLADAFRQASTYVAQNTVTRAGITDHLARVRAVTGDIGRASDAIRRLADLRRWNTRALGTADVTPLLQSGLEALQLSAAASRALFATIERAAPVDPTPDDGFGDEVRAAFAVVLTDLATAIDSFGVLIEEETAGRPEVVQMLFTDATFQLAEARARLTELMMVGPDQTGLWLMRGSILASIEAILSTLDAPARARLREDWEWEQAGLRLGPTTIGPRMRPWERLAHRRRRRTASAPEAGAARPEPRFTGDDLPTQEFPIVGDPPPRPQAGPGGDTLEE